MNARQRRAPLIPTKTAPRGVGWVDFPDNGPHVYAGDTAIVEFHAPTAVARGYQSLGQKQARVFTTTAACPLIIQGLPYVNDSAAPAPRNGKERVERWRCYGHFQTSHRLGARTICRGFEIFSKAHKQPSASPRFIVRQQSGSATKLTRCLCMLMFSSSYRMLWRICCRTFG